MAPYLYFENDHVVEQPTIPDAGSNAPRGYYWRAGLRAPHFEFPQVLPTLTDKAVAILHERAQHKEQPFLLYFAMPSPHTPWVPLPEYRGKSGAGTYGDYVVEVDAMIGRVLDTVHELGMDENTLVVVTSDNGADWKTRTSSAIRIAPTPTGRAKRPTSGRPAIAFHLSRAGRDTSRRTRCAMRRLPH